MHARSLASSGSLASSSSLRGLLRSITSPAYSNVGPAIIANNRRTRACISHAYQVAPAEYDDEGGQEDNNK
eukprot:scaffold168443_cov15-Prasinocladus_malaysianus.AAC.1